MAATNLFPVSCAFKIFKSIHKNFARQQEFNYNFYDF